MVSMYIHMAPVNIKYVVSFTSQDSKNGVENLCAVSDSPRPWLCSAQDRSGVMKAELQLVRAALIGYIDVGNCGSAFIQIDVGRSSWPVDHPYVTLLPTATLMSPGDSRQGTGRTGVRMFKKDDFLPAGREAPWDRVRVTCQQPFNRHAQFGLSFLHIRTCLAETEPRDNVESKTPEQMTSKVREWLSSPAVQRTFFGRTTREAVSEKGAQKSRAGLSWVARKVVTAAASSKHLLPKEQSQTSCGDNVPKTSENHTRRHLERKSVTKKRPAHSHAPPSTKKGRAAARTGSVPAGSSASGTLACPQTECGDSESPETICPLCGGYFTSEYLPMHASSCQGEEEWPLTQVTMATSTTSSPSPSFSPQVDLVPCPLCSFRFPPGQIQQHASSCSDPDQPQWEWLD
ncbi:short transient receptor potential channel 2 [Brienomyrus brachyistius]|uniref:short transient receptor potential channel 2 n=1 Tax=Brienomyrus brachyistius TaxID=42636 RepID=UPI0020B3031B|nr:short transient receptor potential channel 2 [Brienomyrus brachyistius]